MSSADPNRPVGPRSLWSDTFNDTRVVGASGRGGTRGHGYGVCRQHAPSTVAATGGGGGWKKRPHKQRDVAGVRGSASAPPAGTTAAGLAMPTGQPRVGYAVRGGVRTVRGGTPMAQHSQEVTRPTHEPSVGGLAAGGDGKAS